MALTEPTCEIAITCPEARQTYMTSVHKNNANMAHFKQEEHNIHYQWQRLSTIMKSERFRTWSAHS